MRQRNDNRATLIPIFKHQVFRCSAFSILFCFVLNFIKHNTTRDDMRICGKQRTIFNNNFVFILFVYDIHRVF